MNKHLFQILAVLSFSLVLFGCPAELFASPLKTAKLQPILQLDTGGHTSMILDLIVTSDKKYLISCSTDKTIRVWDMQTKKEVRRILGEIGQGHFGMIYAIALSPDDQVLAVGGVFSTGIAKIEHGSIRIYHFPTGELRRVLKSHNNAVLDLSFSPDGRYLVSGSGDKTVKVWDMKDVILHPDPQGSGKNTEVPAPLRGEKIAPVCTFTEHSREVYAVRIFPYQGDYRVVSAALDNQVGLYSLKQKKKLASFLRNDMAYSLAVSDQYIACSGDNDRVINIFDLDLKPVKTIVSETKPIGLAFSPDEILLLAGTGTSPRNCNIYDTQQNFRRIQSFQRHDNAVRALAFADNSIAITGGGNNHDIWFWNPRTGESKGHIAGSGKTVWSVGIKGDEIAFGNKGLQDVKNDIGPLEKAFRLSDFTPFQPQDFSSFRRISTRFQDCTLSHTQGGQYGYKDGILLVEKNGETVSRIERDATNGFRHNCYGFTPDGFILSGGVNGQLKAYDRDGNEIADFIGHTGEVWAIALDGDRLVSGGDDMVIHVWDLKKLREGEKKIFPSFSLVVSNENEWVVWMPEGFFTSSPAGRKFIGYHINRGPENAAEYITVDQLYDLYYRPDLVAKRIQGGFEKEIHEVATRTGNIEEIIQSGLPPMLEVLNAPAKTVKGRNFTLQLKLTDRGGGIGSVVYRVNGVTVGDPKGARAVDFIGSLSSGVIRKDFKLKHGKNIITVTAYNRQGKIQSDPVEIPVVIHDPMSEEQDL